MNPNTPKNTNLPPTIKPLRHIIDYYDTKIKHREYNLNENNQWHGPYKSWRPNGQISFYYNFKNGFHHGLHKTWYPNGQLHIRSNYRNGSYHGLYEQWYADGSLESRCYYKNGKIESV